LTLHLQVFYSHSEALEQLLHLSHYASGTTPPHLKARHHASRARLYGNVSDRKLRKAMADMDDDNEGWRMTETEAAAAVAWQHGMKAGRPSAVKSVLGGAGGTSTKRVEGVWGVAGSAAVGSADGGAGKGGVPGLMAGQVVLTTGQKAQRAWVRILLALSEGKKSETGAMAELVICSRGLKR
jgi:hypothetical protein